MGLPSEAYVALAAHPIQALAGGVLLYFVWTAFYRLYLHPLARIPGPKLAALTFYYEFYYDGIQEGKYTFKIEEMHNQYGKWVRTRLSAALAWKGGGTTNLTRIPRTNHSNQSRRGSHKRQLFHRPGLRWWGKRQKARQVQVLY